MITSKEFDTALQLIVDYKLQLEMELDHSFKDQTIDLQQDLTKNTLRALRYYYESEYEIQIEWEDLKSMDRQLLSEINFDIFCGIRGIGKIALYNLKEILVSKGVLNENLILKKTCGIAHS